MLKDKRGQELSTATIILIVLGVIILVILISGFTIGWNKIMPWINPANNVATIVDQCKTACSLEQKYAYCSQPRELYAEGGVKIPDTTCHKLAINTEYEKYGVGKCLSSVVDCGAGTSTAGTGEGGLPEDITT